MKWGEEEEVDEVSSGEASGGAGDGEVLLESTDERQLTERDLVPAVRDPVADVTVGISPLPVRVVKHVVDRVPVPPVVESEGDAGLDDSASELVVLAHAPEGVEVHERAGACERCCGRSERWECHRSESFSAAVQASESARARERRA